jgi:putative redox protein
MTTSPAPAAPVAVTVERTAHGHYTATNARGGQLTFGTSAEPGFTPVELLLAAIAGCTAIDVDFVTTRRAEPDHFEVRVDADKVKDETGNIVSNIEVTFSVTFPAGEQGDKAREILPDIVRKSHDRLCSVGRTVEAATPISTRIE